MSDNYILITHDNCTCIFHDLSKFVSSAHEVYRFRRALPCFCPGKVTVTIIRSKRGGMFSNGFSNGPGTCSYNNLGEVMDGILTSNKKFPHFSLDRVHNIRGWAEKFIGCL